MAGASAKGGQSRVAPDRATHRERIRSDRFGNLEVILDTNALSASCDDDHELLAVLPSDRPLYLAVIVLGEYRFGIKATRDRAAREEWLERMETALPMLDADSITARRYGDVREELRKARTPIPENDVWIAALARQHQLPVLSRDAHFDNVSGLVRVSW
jgi:predicted nucleic acid-binding protein